MLSTIIGALGGKLIESLFSNLRGAMQDYQNRKISEAEFREKLQEALLLSAREVETAHAELTGKTFASFQKTLQTNPEVTRAWCWVLYTQLFILCWHQFAIPLITLVVQTWLAAGWHYPSSGSTVEWAYALIGFMLGSGAMLMRTGPGAGDLAGRLKAMVGLK